MKKTTLGLLFLFFLIQIFKAENLNAQTTPPGISYQAIARNANGTPYVNANLTVRFSLHEQTATGAVSYAETKSLQTNDLGLFSTTFGSGTPITGTFAGINWAQTTKFLQVEINLGSAWVDMGTQQLMSVPYAMYAGSVANFSNQLPIGSGFTTISSSTYNGTLMQSMSYCFNLEEAGYSDWRLPSLEEVFNYVTLNGVNTSTLSLWTTHNSNYNVLGPQGSVFPFTCFLGGEISIDSPYSVRLTRCVR